MRTPKRTCRPKSKKTIRTMTPLARKLAHLTRAMQGNLKRLAYLTEAFYELERSEKAAQAQIAGHALVCPLAREPVKPAEELYPDPPAGEGIAGEASAGIGGLGAGYHSGSDADPRD